MKMRYYLTLFFISNFFVCLAQTDTTDEVDFSQLEYAGSQTQTFANPKITGLSPQRFFSIGYDHQLPYKMNFSDLGAYEKDENPEQPEKHKATATGGIRLGVMVPLISSNRFLWQTAANYWRTSYQLEKQAVQAGLGKVLQERGLRNLNWINTFFIPLNEKQFLLLQGQSDLSGDYDFGKFQALSTLRYSAAVLWGKRPHDRKQWAVGLSRTYRVGNMNYIPVVMFNYTSENRKWGTEVLFPARAAVRRSFSPRSLLLMGYELEGQSYRISALSDANRSLEIRRGELRFRLDYQFQLSGFFWAGIQAGMRLDYSYDADNLENNREFFRGFFGTQKFAMKNTLENAPYLQVSINFVSP